MKSLIIFLLSTFIFTASLAQNSILPLWEEDPPNYREIGEVTIWDTSDIVRVRNVQKPDIAIYLSSKKNATGEAVVICPGGGYQILAYDWEGSDIARWLNSKGIAAFVLKYRLPGSSNNIEPRLSPLMDAQRALRMVRTNAEKWNMDASSTDPELEDYYSNEKQITEDTPPAILIHSADDAAVPLQNSLAYYDAIRKYNKLSELHVYPYGGHGYSLAIGRGHLSTWPDRVIDWIGYLNEQQ